MLAVFSTQLGIPFISRYLTDLFPGEAVAVAANDRHPLIGHSWRSPRPAFYIDDWRLRMSVRVRLRVGMKYQHLRDAAIESFLKKHKVKVILGEYLDFMYQFVPLFDRLHIPYVVQGHGIDVSAALRKPGMAGRYAVFQSAKAILVRCRVHRERLIDLGLPAERIFVNWGGVDLPSELLVKSEASRKRFLAVSRMDSKKGPIFLLEAFRRAFARDASISLDFVGDGPLYPAVQQFVTAMGLQDCVRLHGSASEEEKYQLLRDCSVFVQHSVTDPVSGDEEGLPAAIQEAMAYGLSVVSTRHAGIPDAVEEGVSGYIVDERDVDGMADAMISVLPEAHEMGMKGYELAKKHHSWQGEKDRLRKWLMIDFAKNLS